MTAAVVVLAGMGRAEDRIDQEQEAAVELALCRLVKRTSNYIKQKLDVRGNCLAAVKSYGDLVCLRDENQIVS